jgi:hypothetical protein
MFLLLILDYLLLYPAWMMVPYEKKLIISFIFSCRILPS